MKYLLPIASICLATIIAIIALTRDETAPRVNLILTEAGSNDLYISSGVRRPVQLPTGDQFNRYSGMSEDGRWLRYWDNSGHLWHYDMHENKTHSLGDESVRRYIGQVDGWLYLENRAGIHRVRLDGSERTQIFALDSDDTSAIFSPDRQWFIYKANLRQFARVRRDGSQHLVLTPADEIHHFDGWSDDGHSFYTIGTLDRESHLTQVNVNSGELRVVVRGIDKFFGEYENGLLFEADGTLYRQNLLASQREVIFAVPDFYVQDVVWTYEWLYVEVFNEITRLDEIFAVRHDGTGSSPVTVSARYAPLMQSGSVLASTTPADTLMFISGREVIALSGQTKEALVDVQGRYFIYERILSSGVSQYFAQATGTDTPLFLAERPAGYGVVDIIFVDTGHWTIIPLVLLAMGLLGMIGVNLATRY
ncbi:MAG: DUF5050 domain-containing protein [Chloroflexi bacterium]|nr:DUF5050 domain-containing protein [Chloroflexota bacterium]